MNKIKFGVIKELSNMELFRQRYRANDIGDMELLNVLQSELIRRGAPEPAPIVKENKTYKRTFEEMVCHCGKHFLVTKGKYKNSKRLGCSRSCAQQKRVQPHLADPIIIGEQWGKESA